MTGVDVWYVSLDATPEVTRVLAATLSAGEAERAARFVTEQLRTAYTVSHGALRVLLARRLNCGPKEVEFVYGAQGKPALAGGGAATGFNMSHAGGLAAYAFASGLELGIDIEAVREMPDLNSIARRYFAPGETAQLQSIADERERREAFFRCWTRKESYIKAAGGGLSMALDRFEVTLLAGSAARFVHIGGDASEAEAWTLEDLAPAPAYMGALAYRGAARGRLTHGPASAREIADLMP